MAYGVEAVFSPVSGKFQVATSRLPHIFFSFMHDHSYGSVRHCIADDTNIFVQNLSLSFLRHHGGLALPMQAKEFPYKMFSYIFIHFDFWHLFTNMLLFLWLGAYLERKY